MYVLNNTARVIDFRIMIIITHVEEVTAAAVAPNNNSISLIKQ